MHVALSRKGKMEEAVVCSVTEGSYLPQPFLSHGKPINRGNDDQADDYFLYISGFSQPRNM